MSNLSPTLMPQPIGVCSANDTQVTVACGRDLLVFTIGAGGQLTEVSKGTLDHEVACVDITPAPGASASDLMLVGMWTDHSARVLKVSDLTMVARHDIGGDIVPRSALMVRLEDTDFALVAMGDGSMNYSKLDRASGVLADSKRVQLGTRPVLLQTFVTGGMLYVFASSDRPTVMYSSNGKILFSHVSLAESTCMCTLNTDVYKDWCAAGGHDLIALRFVKFCYVALDLNTHAFRLFASAPLRFAVLQPCHCQRG